MRSWVARFVTATAELPPEKIALILATGLVLGTFPLMGCPTLLCLLAAMVLRINPAALLLLNNISSPLQLALLVPLARAGSLMCGGGAVSAASTGARLGTAALHAVAGWACICIPLGVALYFVVLHWLRRCRPVWFNSVESPA
ncbi:MAG TPA: DUF2062 domain-containing protein [Candidatus Acidoferrum sp.]|nr:DUF2062 domain-containing protein [Candidatus Acidoferrum sp.]